MVDTLRHLAASALPNALLRTVARTKPLATVLSVAEVTARNVQVQGRFGLGPAQFVASIEHWPRLRISCLEHADFWFELDTAEPSLSSGRLCCQPVSEALPNELQSLAQDLQSDPRYILLPRQGSCWLSLLEESHSRTEHRYRFDCLAHLASWLEIKVLAE